MCYLLFAHAIGLYFYVDSLPVRLLASAPSVALLQRLFTEKLHPIRCTLMYVYNVSRFFTIELLVDGTSLNPSQSWQYFSWTCRGTCCNRQNILNLSSPWYADSWCGPCYFGSITYLNEVHKWARSTVKVVRFCFPPTFRCILFPEPIFQNLCEVLAEASTRPFPCSRDHSRHFAVVRNKRSYDGSSW